MILEMMPHDINTVKTTWPWYIPNTRIFKHSKHLSVKPVREIIFKGPFYSVREAKIWLKNLSKINVVYILETLSPDRFVVTPRVGVIHPRTTATVKVTMFPNIVNENLVEVYTFRLYSILAMGRVNLSIVSRGWMNRQAHITYEEFWTSRFEQQIEPLSRTAFRCCLKLPLPPPKPQRQLPPAKIMQRLGKLYRSNVELRFRVESLKEEDLRASNPRQPSLVERYLDELLTNFGFNTNNLRPREIRLMIFLMEFTIFFVGMLFSKLL